jgi:hypothetical protein
MVEMLPSRRGFILGAALIFSGSATRLLAQAQERVKFEKGNDNTAVNGRVTGEGYNDYLLGAKAGQKMSVSLISDKVAYFNILPPGGTGEAIYNSSSEGNDATSVALPKSGDYTIRVYLMGAAADEGKSVDYQLSIAIM